MEETLSKDRFYTLEQIADWQLNGDEIIKLPVLQRSFVWRPHQIETIWDSILRGFPIGAFLLSETNFGTLELLDGQQRCTSISLGFFNPWEKKGAHFFDKKNTVYEHIPTVWIDLNPEKLTNTNKFLIRVLTQSHPWGYQAKNNNSILTASERRNALKVFQDGREKFSYTKLKNTEVYPFEANLPVPLVFVLELIQTNITDIDKDVFYERISKIKIVKKKLNTYEQFINSDLFEDFILTIKNSIGNYKIPSITIKKSILKNDAITENVKEDPTLFVRLNSQGTAIGGEELIYSIYKAEFPKSKDLVENVSASFIQPSRLISFTSRIVWSNMTTDLFPNNFSVNQFRERLNVGKFAEKLEQFIGSDSESEASKVFDKSIKILTTNDDITFPPVLAKSIVNEYSEVYLFLLYWIFKNFETITEKDYGRIRKKFLYLCWFSLDKDKICKSLWENVSNYSFWNSDVFETIILKQKLLLKLPIVSDLRKQYHNLIENSTRWSDFYPSPDDYKLLFNNKLKDILNENSLETELYRQYWDHLTNQLAWNRNILIFCQKGYFAENFSEFNSLEVLVDTNRPWDYDHIYPSSWVYNKRDVNPQIRELHNMNGNLRAITLEENRSESDHKKPNERLDADNFDKYFIKDDWNYWEKIDGRIWDDEIAKNFVNAVVLRTTNIYNELFEYFK